MVTVLTILALAIFFDLMLNNGEGIANIISSFRKSDIPIKTEMEILTEMITSLNEELENLKDELSDAIDEEEEHVEIIIRKKIRTKQEILKVFLNKLENLNEAVKKNT